MVVDNNSGGGESSQCICFTRSNFPSRFNTISDPNDHDIYHETSDEREYGGSEQQLHLLSGHTEQGEWNGLHCD